MVPHLRHAANVRVCRRVRTIRPPLNWSTSRETGNVQRMDGAVSGGGDLVQRHYFSSQHRNAMPPPTIPPQQDHTLGHTINTLHQLKGAHKRLRLGPQTPQVPIQLRRGDRTKSLILAGIDGSTDNGLLPGDPPPPKKIPLVYLGTGRSPSGARTKPGRWFQCVG